MTTHPMKPGDLFTLVGRPTLMFRVDNARHVLGGVPVVDGVSLDGKRRTTARVADTVSYSPTGRLHSAPALQGIPVRTDEGRRIRSAFIGGGRG